MPQHEPFGAGTGRHPPVAAAGRIGYAARMNALPPVPVTPVSRPRPEGTAGGAAPTDVLGIEARGGPGGGGCAVGVMSGCSGHW